MTRYPLALDEHEDTFARLDDHLTEAEMRARFAEIDRLAVRAKWTPERPPQRRERSWQSLLGLTGSWIIALASVSVIWFVVL